MHKKYTWRTAEKTIYPIKKAPSIATLPKVNPQGWTEKSNFGGFIYE
ncbi:hypothetical protein ABUE38_01325 [Pediococcus parvulus]